MLGTLLALALSITPSPTLPPAPFTGPVPLAASVPGSTIGAPMEMTSDVVFYWRADAWNMVRFPEGLSNPAWTVAGATLLSGMPSNDGDLDATGIVEDGSALAHVLSQAGINVGTAGTFTESWLVKPAGRTWTLLQFVQGTNPLCYFNLVGAGSVGTCSGGAAGVISLDGNGFYRVSINAAISGVGSFRVYAANGDGVVNYQGVPGLTAIVVYGPSLTRGSAITNHVDQPVANTLASPSDFTTAIWSRQNVTVGADQAYAPDGTLTADLVTATGASPQVVNLGLFNSATATMTASIWARAASGTAPVGTVSVGIFDNFRAVFDCTLSAPALTATWTQLSCTSTSAALGHNLTFAVQLFPAAAPPVFLWGSTLTRADMDGDTFVMSNSIPVAPIAGPYAQGTGAGHRAVGPFTDANWVQGYPTASDPLDSTGDRYGCIAFSPSVAFDVTRYMISNGLINTAGHNIYWQPNFTFTSSTPTAQVVTSPNQPVVGALNVGCWWRTGTTTFAKLNFGVTGSTSGVATEVSGTAFVQKIGRGEGAGNPFVGTIFEYVEGLGSPTGYSSPEAWATAQMSFAFANGGQDLPLFLDNSHDVVHLDGRSFPGSVNVDQNSQDFSQATWNKTNVTLAAVQPDPLGGTNAFTITDTAANSTHQLIGNSVTSTIAPWTCSFYVKAGTLSWVALSADSGASAAWFDTVNGAIGTVQAGNTPAIATTGVPGWYRVSTTKTESGAGVDCRLLLAPSNGVVVYVGGTGTVTAFGSQFEAGASTSSYVATGASAAGIWRAPQFGGSIQNGAVPFSDVVSPVATRGVRDRLGYFNWSGTQNLQLGAALSGLDVLDFANDFRLCVTWRRATNAGSEQILDNDLINAAGYRLQAQTGAGNQLVVFDAGSGNLVLTTTNGYEAPGLNVSCMGRAGATGFTKLNLGASASGAMPSGWVPATSTVAALSPQRSGASAGTDLTIYELIASNLPYTDAWAALQVRRVFGLPQGRGEPLTLVNSRSTSASYLSPDFSFGRMETTAAPTTVPVGTDGVEAWAAATNSALQSETSCVANAVQAPWVIVGAPTCATDAAPSPAGTTTMDRWTSAANTDLVSQTVIIPASTTYTFSSWIDKAGGGTASLIANCPGGVANGCTCGTLNGSACTAAGGTINCIGKFTAMTAVPTLAWVTPTCSVATAAPGIFMAPGEYLVSTGTADFWGAQVTATPYPMRYVSTAAAAVTANADVITTPLPPLHLSNRWCLGVTATPGLGRSWSQAGLLERLTSNFLAAAVNIFDLYVTAGTLKFDVWDSAGVVKTVAYTPGGALAPGTPHRIVACDNVGALGLWVDGQPVGSVSGAGTALWTATPTPTQIGSQAGATQWDGSLRDLRIFPGTGVYNSGM